jgi:hypothetical protein
MYILKFFTFLFLVLFLKSALSERIIVFLLSVVIILILFIDKFAGFLANQRFISFGVLGIGALLLLLVGLVLIKSVLSFKTKKYFSIGVCSCLILILPAFSHAQDFRQYSVTFEGTFNEARSDYTNLTQQRTLVLDISKSIRHTPRSWFIPDSGVPLVSSQLFLYSMISDVPGKANCAQVDWAGNYNSLLYSFGYQDLDRFDVTKLYLAECGYEAIDLILSFRLSQQLEDIGGKVWQLRPKN